MKAALTTILLTLLVLGGCSEPTTHFSCVNKYDSSREIDLTYRISGEFYAFEKTWIIVETTEHHYKAESTYTYKPSVIDSKFDLLKFNRLGEEHKVTFSTSELAYEQLKKIGEVGAFGFYVCKETTRF